MLAVVAAIAVLALSLSSAALWVSWSNGGRIERAIAQVDKALAEVLAHVRDEQKAIRRGSAAFEVQQRQPIHEMRNRIVAIDERLDRIEETAVGRDGKPIGPHPAKVQNGDTTPVGEVPE
jgi:hypothetical protein